MTGLNTEVSITKSMNNVLRVIVSSRKDASCRYYLKALQRDPQNFRTFAKLSAEPELKLIARAVPVTFCRSAPTFDTLLKELHESCRKENLRRGPCVTSTDDGNAILGGAIFLLLFRALQPPSPLPLASLSSAPSKPVGHWIPTGPRHDVEPRWPGHRRRCYDTVSRGLLRA